MDKSIKDAINTAAIAMTDKIRDVQCLLDAIGKFNPGGHEDRLAAMAEKQLEEVCAVLDSLPTVIADHGGHRNG